MTSTPSSLQNSPQFVATDDELAIVRHCMQHGTPVLLRGPTGCGKTLCVAQAAADLGKRVVTVTAERGMSASKILGAFQLRGQETHFVAGPLVAAARTPDTVFYLDEVRFAPAEALSALHPLLDHRRELFIPETGETIPAAPGFCFAASYNPGQEFGRGNVSPALRQRCVTVEFGYLSPKLEAKVLAREAQCSRKLATKLVEVAAFLRTKCAGLLPSGPSTRLLILTAGLVQSGVVAYERAVVRHIVCSLSDDPAVCSSALNALRVAGLLSEGTLHDVASVAALHESGHRAEADEFFNKR